ncbi:hypothetical protein D9613_004336 [Agrocybe pediades]|uniref:Uncharacterized protein n=1 Tax=Agrocybe pediades TaxID=84607 RepID=A0A8H4VKR0_9AGAR|nr:hypothetical protein D9613_004336 [Agrocybe pediades]
MLNPPLSTLPYDILSYIVDHVAALLSADKDIKALCLADRVFTYACQTWIFQTLYLDGSFERPLKQQVYSKANILASTPVLSRRVRKIHLYNIQNKFCSLLSDPRLVAIFQMLALSPKPPSELEISTIQTYYVPLSFASVALLPMYLSKKILPQTLTSLRLEYCRDVSPSIFHMLPLLREVYLTEARQTRQTTDVQSSYHGDLRLPPGSRAPALEVLSHSRSHTILAQMVTPSDPTNPVVNLSNLKMLQLAPYDWKSVRYLPEIFSVSGGSLRELYLDLYEEVNYRGEYSSRLHLALILRSTDTGPSFWADLMDFSKVPHLQVFALHALFGYDDPDYIDIIRDIVAILRRVPDNNKITNIALDFAELDVSSVCFDARWTSLCMEVKRIASKNRIEFDFELYYPDYSDEKIEGLSDLVEKMQDDVSSFFKSSKVCVHTWTPKSSVGAMKIGTHRPRCAK